MKRIYVMILMCVFLSGCSGILRTTEEQVGGFIRVFFSPVKSVINEVRDFGHSDDFRLSQGDTSLVFPKEDLREYTYTMNIVGINAIGQTVKFNAVAEIQNPRNSSQLPQEIVTPMMSASDCPPQQPCPEPLVPSVEVMPNVACFRDPNVITLTTWLKAIGRTGFTMCQTVIDEETGTPYLVEVVYAEPKCAITLEEQDTRVWEKHDTIREQGYDLVPLYPEMFLNTIAGAQQTALPQIDACVYGVPLPEGK